MTSVKLEHGDSLELSKSLEDKSIELVLTDPPYNVSRKNNFTTMGRAGIDFGEWDHDFNVIGFLPEVARVLTKDGSAIIFNSWANLGPIAAEAERLGLVIKDMLRWEKSNPMPRNMNRRYVTDYEVAVWLTNKNAKWTFNNTSGTYLRPKFVYPVVSGTNRHPTQKPAGLLEDLIYVHSNENDTVLDLFAGSGSTGVAAVKLNRNFVGYEIDQGYFNLAKSNLNME